ncbi:MAG: hypothetical protein ABWY23_10190 [Mycetocola sp.]
MSGRETSQQQSQPWWPLVAAVVVAVVVNALSLGIQRGECVDYTAESGRASACTMGPAIGVPAATVLVIVSVLTIAYLVWLQVKANSER